VYCAVCQRQTSPIRIDGQDYCSVCGNLYQPAATPKDRPAATPNPAPAPRTAKAATDLHQRAGTQVLDLRDKARKLAAEPSAVLPATGPAAITGHAPGHRTSIPAASEHEHHVAAFTDRFERARQFGRSAQISRFGTDRMGNVLDPHQMYDKFGNKKLQTIVDQAHHTGAFAESAMPSHVTAQHQAMTRLTPAPVPDHAIMNAAMPARRPNLSFSPGARRAATVAAAIAVLGGYVWLHNYPKLAIQSAGAQAGVSASLPGYVPSSYHLSSTSSIPGLLTLNFDSPSADTALKISQQRTVWDPSSLLDNYVAKNSDDYAAVEGQGLTIYLFGNNNATWVNRGIWYSITGADRLSRDQVLRIAYSL
jgi:hypothetical protein